MQGSRKRRAPAGRLEGAGPAQAPGQRRHDEVRVTQAGNSARLSRDRPGVLQAAVGAPGPLAGQPVEKRRRSMIRVLREEVLDESHWTYKRVVYDIEIGGRIQQLSREILDRGDAAAVLLYNARLGCIILTRQFRLPAFLNGGQTSLLEACAGGIEDGDPTASAIRETREETGFEIAAPRLAFEAYMSPGSLTEKIYFFVAPYEAEDRLHPGGGLEHEGESIETIEMPFSEALDLLAAGKILDAKTILLLQYAQIHGLLTGPA
jgi:GDP-mannose pyrophosphatase NudK